MERIMYKTPAFDSFYNSLNVRAKKKVDYVFEHIRTEKNVSAKFVKSLINTDFYEMRISVDNEYRIILFTIDNENFTNSKEIILLNGFLKKSTSDYDKQISIAKKLMEDFL
jgi:phage-related protein